MATINDWGAFLSKHNLTSDMLLSYNLSITATDVTNELVLDLHEFMNRHSGCTLDSFSKGFLYENYCLSIHYKLHILSSSSTY